MNDNLKEYLIKYNESKGWGTTERDLIETVTEGDVIHKEIVSNHRWYDDEERIVKIGDKFIRYYNFHITGDKSPSDMGLEIDIDSIQEVIKKQKLTDYYEAI